MRIKVINQAITLLVLILALSGCSVERNNTTTQGILGAGTHLVNVEKLEVYHFHATRQCYTCKTVGAFSEETVNTYFSDELKSGKLVFAHVNIELAENKALVDKSETNGSSLLIGVYGKDGTFSKQEDTNVWYKISDKEEYLNYLKGVIEQKLAGN